MDKSLPLRKALTLAIALFPLFSLGVPALHADDTPGVPTCEKRAFKEVKTVTPFSITHRPQAKKMLYDDIACGLKWRGKQCSSGQGNFDSGAVVYDFNTLAEIPVGEATFIQSAGIVSPMGSSLAAFASAADADAFLSQKGEGKRLTYQEVLLLDFK